MEYIILFGILFLANVLQFVAFLVLYSKYKDVKYNANRWQPPF